MYKTGKDLSYQFKNTGIIRRAVTAKELAGFLRDRWSGTEPPVRVREGDAYNTDLFQYEAVPPCHVRHTDGMSFHFGDHPEGGVVMRCWNCDDMDFYDRVESIARCAVQVRKWDGSLRYFSGKEENLKRYINLDFSPAHRKIEATPSKETTIKDLLELPIWFLANGKKPLTYVTYDNKMYSFRHSMAEEKGGITAARFGCCLLGTQKTRKQTIVNWAPYHLMVMVNKAIRENPNNYVPPAKPAISLSGTAILPACHDIGILDFDIPESGDFSKRDAVRLLFQDLGFPIFLSNSGRGFHVVFRAMEQDYSKLKVSQVIPHSSAREKAEIFMPSAKRHIVLNVDKPYGDTNLETVIPFITQKLIDLVKEKL